MKPISALLMMSLIAASTASGVCYGAERGDLQERGATQELRGQAPRPPRPPAPPVPPTPPGPANDAIAPQPPQPPMHPSMSTAPLPPLPPVPPAPLQPSIPAPPYPPAPPAAPPKPVVPKAAHQACVGKSVGAAAAYTVRKGAIMRGTCQMDSSGMYFDLNSYQVDN